MSIKISGSVKLDISPCYNCNNHIYVSNDKPKQIEICVICGARHILKNIALTKYNEIEAEVEPDGFNCLSDVSSYSISHCLNKCPSPSMFCKDHSGEISIDQAKDNIVYRKKDVTIAKERLKMIESSRKIWAITQLSGIDNE